MLEPLLRVFFTRFFFLIFFYLSPSFHPRLLLLPLLRFFFFFWNQEGTGTGWKEREKASKEKKEGGLQKDPFRLFDGLVWPIHFFSSSNWTTPAASPFSPDFPSAAILVRHEPNGFQGGGGLLTLNLTHGTVGFVEEKEKKKIFRPTYNSDTKHRAQLTSRGHNGSRRCDQESQVLETKND